MGQEGLNTRTLCPQRNPPLPLKATTGLVKVTVPARATLPILIMLYVPISCLSTCIQLLPVACLPEL